MSTIAVTVLSTVPLKSAKEVVLTVAKDSVLTFSLWTASAVARVLVTQSTNFVAIPKTYQLVNYLEHSSNVLLVIQVVPTRRSRLVVSSTSLQLSPLTNGSALISSTTPTIAENAEDNVVMTRLVARATANLWL